MTELDVTLAWVRAFAVTLAVELAVAPVLLRRHVASFPRGLALVGFAQLVSHPVLWFVLPAVVASRAVYLTLAELWAWLSEASLYAVALPSLSPRRALGAALAANAASLSIGLGLRALGAPV